MPHATAIQRTPARAVMQLRAVVPDDAMTSELLGTEREGLAVCIRKDGLAVTVGYLCLEASDIWLSNTRGETTRAHVIAQDTESGLALLRPDLPVDNGILTPVSSDGVEAGQSLRIVNSTEDFAINCTLVAVSEFAGRWEYLVERALYTVPACDNWGGAALLDSDGGLLGIGSLFLELPGASGGTVYGNLFVPVDLITPHIDDLCLHGARRTPPRPWMGWMVHEHEGSLMVVGIYPGGPADRAGIRVENTVSAVEGQAVSTIAELFRAVWSRGAAGVEIGVTVRADGSVRDARVRSVERNGFFQARHGEPVN